MKKKLVLLFLLINMYVFAKVDTVLNFDDIRRLASIQMQQQDGSIVFDGKRDYLKMDNPALNSNEMAVYMKFKLTSSDFFNRTCEIINIADSEVESYGKWGLSVNYTKDGLWALTCDPVMFSVNNYTKFKFAVGSEYELYIYLDDKNIRVYIDGKCIAENHLPYGYYKAEKLYIGAGILRNSYSGMQLYDFEILTGKQSKEESEKRAFKGNADIEKKTVLTIEDLRTFVRGKRKLEKDIEIKSGECVTLINPMKKSDSFGAYLDFTFNCKTQILRNTLEFFNTADSIPEIRGKWGISLNYDRSGLSLLIDGTKTQTVKTGVFFRENERYSLFVYIDSNDIFIYVNGKCIKRSTNTNALYKNASYLHIGAGILANSYTPMILHDFKLTNKTAKNKKELDTLLLSLTDETSDYTEIASSEKKHDFSLQLQNKENYFLAGAIASYATSAVSLAFIPVCFGIYGYNSLVYEENAGRYNKAVYQEQLDLYYKEMQKSYLYANAALTSGIVLIPICTATLVTGVIFTVIYQKLKIEHLPSIAFGYVPSQSCMIQFSIPL
ncbi:MAG: hypothetical protein J1G30_09310 [Spirochaetales bacterium]|nr:hypothetical protein [Spirochaetales bacterium]